MDISSSTYYSVTGATNSYSSKGLAGLASGMDTETMVKKMLSGVQTKIDKQTALQTQTGWKQDLYREVISSINTFGSSYIDTSYDSTLTNNLSSAKLFNSTISKVTSGSSVKVVSSSQAAMEDMSIVVNQLASAASFAATSTMSGTRTITGAALDETKLNELSAAFSENDGKLELTLNVDGVEKGITVEAIDDGNGNVTAQSVKEGFEAAVKKAFGENVSVSLDGDNKLNIAYKTNEAAHQVTVSGADSAYFGINPGATTAFSTATKLSDLAGVTATDGKVVFSINGTNFEFDETDDVATVINKVNNSDSGVKLAYSTISDKFTISSTNTGASYGINVNDQTGLFNKLFGENTVDANGELSVNNGTDALFEINGVSTSRTSNTFSMNGVTLQLTNVSEEATVIGTAKDTDKIVNAIKSFVNDYNTLIKKLNEYVDEDPNYRKYAPLTDAQKDEMSDSEIKLWEEKTKQGLLYRDTYVESFLSQMRSTLYTKPTGSSYALYDIGIETATWSSGGESKGQLVIDEAALRTALETDPESVQTLFTDKSEGLAVKIKAIVDETASTSSSKPGLMVSAAGVKGSATEKNNTMYDTLKSIASKISDLKDKYDRDKEKYWSQFSSMETILSNYNSQSSMISNMFSTT